MATIAKLGIKLEADGEGFSSGVEIAAAKAKKLEDQAKRTGEAAKKMGDDAAKGADKAAAAMRKAADEERKKAEQRAKENSIGGRIEALNKTFGADSALGKISGALAGGAFVGGLTLLAGGFEKVAEKAKGLAKEYARGRIDAREYAVELGMSIPIIGDVAKGMISAANALVLMTGGKPFEVVTEESIARMERMDKAFAAIREGMKQTERLQQELVEARLTGVEKEVYDANKRAREAEKAAREAFALDSQVDKTAGSRLREQLDLIKQRLKEDLERIEKAPLLKAAEERAANIKAMMDSIAKSARQAGMTDSEKLLDDLKEGGASDKDIEVAKQNIKTAESAKKAKDAIDEARRVFDEMEKAAEDKVKQNRESIQQTLNDLHKQLDQFKMTESERKLDDVRRLGGSEQTVESVRRLQKELDLMARKKELIEGLETPQQKYNKQLVELNELMDKGMLTQAEYAAAALQNLEEFKRSQKAMEPGRVGLAVLGSAEAATSLRSSAAGQGSTPQSKEMLGLQKLQAERLKKQNELTEQILSGKGIIQFTVATL